MIHTVGNEDEDMSVHSKYYIINWQLYRCDISIGLHIGTQNCKLSILSEHCITYQYTLPGQK